MAFNNAVLELETELTNALAAITDNGDPNRIERFLRLLIKKEIILKMLIMDIDRL